MTMLTTFAPPARQTVIRAGLLASEGGTSRLSDGYLLLALAESQPLTSPVDLGVTAAMVRAQLKTQARRRHDRDLLATLGIDLDEVRRRALDATSTRLDDPALWRLRRSRIRPLRVTLTGPAADITLNEGGRKAIEVARWPAVAATGPRSPAKTCSGVCSRTPPANRSGSSAAARSISPASGPTFAAGTNRPEAPQGVRLSYAAVHCADPAGNRHGGRMHVQSRAKSREADR
jgi:hypothetical protein